MLGVIIYIVVLQWVRIHKIQFPCMDVRKVGQKFIRIKAHPHSIPIIYGAYGVAHDLYIFQTRLVRIPLRGVCRPGVLAVGN